MFRSCPWFLLFAVVCSHPLAFAEPQQEGDDRAKPMCEDLKEVPLLQKIRKMHDTVTTEGDQLATNITSFQSSCSTFSSDPKQTGITRDKIVKDGQSVGAQNKKFHEAVEALRPDIEKANKPLENLGESSCRVNLAKAWRRIQKRKADFAAQANNACRDKDARAAALSNILATKDPSAQDAILNPKKYPEKSQQLLKQAKEYWQSLPPDQRGPDPQKNANDKVCGESCVSYLRMQSAEGQYGKNSPQYESAMETAQATKLGRYGTLENWGVANPILDSAGKAGTSAGPAASAPLPVPNPFRAKPAPLPGSTISNQSKKGDRLPLFGQ